MLPGARQTTQASRSAPGVAYHVISRFVAKEWFIESALERRMYLALIGHALSSSDWTCFAYAVMSSHIHLALIAGSAPLASWLRPAHTLFANWMNERRQRIGAVFVKGPNMLTVPTNACAKLINYIHYNPVRAGVVRAPEESDWTSHRAYVGAAPAPRWLSVETGLALSDFATASDLQAWCASTQVHREELPPGVLPRASRGRPAAAPGSDAEKAKPV
jgi:hypothetical protein